MQSPAHSDMDFSETQHSSPLGVGDADSNPGNAVDAQGGMINSLTARPSSQPRRGSLPTDLNAVEAVRANTNNDEISSTNSSQTNHVGTSLITLVNRSSGSGQRRGSGDSGANNHRTVDISSQLRFPRSIMITRVDDKIFDFPEEKTRFAQIFKNIDPECTVLFFKTFNRVRVDFTHHQAALSARRMVTSSTENNLPSAGLSNGHHEPQQHAQQLADHGQRSQSSDTLLGGVANNNQPLATHNMKCIWFFNILQEMNLNSTLKPPKLEKQFLISPPASPPVGWEPVHEHEPIIDYDVLTAIAELDPNHSHELHPSGGNEHPAIVFHPCPDDDENDTSAVAEGNNTSDDFTEEDDGTTADKSGERRGSSASNNSDGAVVKTAGDAEEMPHIVTSGKRARRRVQIKMVSASSLDRADSFSDDYEDTASNASSASSSPSRRRNVAMRIGNHRVVIPHTRRPPPLSSEKDADSQQKAPSSSQ